MDRSAKAERHIVSDFNRLLNITSLIDNSDRTEQRLIIDIHRVVNICENSRRKPSTWFVFEHTTLDQYRRASLNSAVELCLQIDCRRFRGQWSDKGFFIKRVAQCHVTYRMGKGFDKLIIDRFDDDQTFGGITSLSCITKTTFDCPLYGLFDIGIGCNDKGIRATKL